MGWRGTGVVLGLASLVIAGCGMGLIPPDAGGGSAGSLAESDGSGEPAPVGTCAPHQPPSEWAPAWRPPKSPTPGACTDEQIQQDYALCQDPRITNPAQCDAFRNDPANETCVECMFSRSDDPSYGPIVLLGNAWRPNIDGCIALLTGDFSEAGCAAKLQASIQCRDSSCQDVCPNFDSFRACWGAAGDMSCGDYVLKANCASSPRFAMCTGSPTNKDGFLTMVHLFCGTGFPDGGIVDGGG